MGPPSPFVSVIMPVRNEERFLGHSLGSVLAQDYPPERYEVLVVDGMSEDGTREAVRRLSGARLRDGGDPVEGPHPAVRILENPARFVPQALNIGLRHARGDVIVRVDGHCEVGPDYLRRCVELLAETGAEVVGGPMRPVGHGAVAESIALAMGSAFEIGDVRAKALGEAGWTSVVPFGAYPRALFDRIGGFDESLVRNQDNDFYRRVREAGGRIWSDPSIHLVYYSRSTFGRLWSQHFDYGGYRVREVRKWGRPESWRQLVPPAFVLGCAAGAVGAVLTGTPWLAGAVPGPYLVANLLFSLGAGWGHWRALPLLPLAFATRHVALGAGFLWGLVRR